jgi:hypothetical protein
MDEARERELPQLLELRQWLSENLGNDRAIFTTEIIKAFFSNNLLAYESAFFSHVAITARNEANLFCRIWLHVLARDNQSSLEQSIAVNRLIHDFTHQLAIPLSPDPDVSFECFTPQDIEGNSFEELVFQICLAEKLAYFGLFALDED